MHRIVMIFRLLLLQMQHWHKPIRGKIMRHIPLLDFPETALEYISILWVLQK